jgi:hypothetical protein
MFNQVVANFKDPHTTASNFQAMLDRGDGSAMTAGRIRRTGNGKYSVIGNHVYLTAGPLQAHVVIVDAQGRMLDVVDPVQVK